MNKADYALENAYELLTDEGEWYLDKTQSMVYFKPFSESDFNSETELSYAGLKTFFLLDGSLTQPVRNFAIRGICFQYSKGTKMGVTAGFPMGPNSSHIPKPESAIQVNAGHKIIIHDNFFFHIGYDAIHFDLQGSDIQITGNGFADISRSAISLNQTNLVISNKSKEEIMPENQHKFFDGVDIRNNYVRMVGLDAPSQGISFSEFTRNLRCIHNEIRHVSTYAVSNNWRFLGWRGHAGKIEYAWNKTSEVGREGLKDFGALYVSCSNVGFTKIHHNHIDGVGMNSNNFGIYLDVFTDKAEVYNNVCVNMPYNKRWDWLHGAWFLGACVNLVISKNTKVYNNWSDALNYRDFDQGRYRFWKSRTNKFYGNHRIESMDHLPSVAQEVVSKAGLEPQYQSVKEQVESLLVK